jgi:hypothetical protein
MISQRLDDLVLNKLKALSVPREVLSEMPYSIWHIGDLEAGMQVVDEIGIRRFMDGKILDPEMKRWEWRAYLMHMFKGRYSRKTLFLSDFDTIFSRVTGHSAEV